MAPPLLGMKWRLWGVRSGSALASCTCTNGKLLGCRWETQSAVCGRLGLFQTEANAHRAHTRYPEIGFVCWRACCWCLYDYNSLRHKYNILMTESIPIPLFWPICPLGGPRECRVHTQHAATTRAAPGVCQVPPNIQPYGWSDTPCSDPFPPPSSIFHRRHLEQLVRHEARLTLLLSCIPR